MRERKEQEEKLRERSATCPRLDPCLLVKQYIFGPCHYKLAVPIGNFTVNTCCSAQTQIMDTCLSTSSYYHKYNQQHGPKFNHHWQLNMILRKIIIVMKFREN